MIRYVGGLLSVLPPILLAGFRDVSVGSDMQLYINPIFEYLQSTDGNLGIVRDRWEDVEFMYLFLNYIVYYTTNSFVCFLIALHALIIIPLYVSAMKWRNFLSPVYFFLIYYCIFYQETLSIVRQSLAISFAILSITYFIDRKVLKFSIFAILSISFHSTAVIALLIPLLYKILSIFPIKKYYLGYLLILLATSYFLMSIDSIFIWLINSGLIGGKYLIYTSGGNTFEANLGMTNIVVKVAILFYMLLVLIKYKPNIMIDTFLVLEIIDLILSLCGLIAGPLDRFSLYFRLMLCISLPFLFKNCPLFVYFNSYRISLPVRYPILLLLCAFWVYVYMMGDYDSTSVYMINRNL